MTFSNPAEGWAEEFGLALTSLFGTADKQEDGDHYVLLDGGHGSFALSVTPEAIWKNENPSNWSWSSDLSHHVTVTDTEVGVVRWDKPTAEVFTRRSVEEKHNEFYQYLMSDRVGSNRRVVSHFLEAYRRMRSLVSDAGLEDGHSTSVFLSLISLAIARSLDVPFDLKEGKHELLSRISNSALEALLKFLLDTPDFTQNQTLFPSLAIRHAGSEIFQEAHYELVRSPSPDLFGYVEPAVSGLTSRGGAHFTPPALARSLTEEVLKQVSELHTRREITVMDPACGSGAFLHEAMRTLERSEFNGKLRLVGRDISQSAVSMAEFALNSAMSDWTPAGGIEIDLSASDSLNEDLPLADIILMNPPFISWSSMNKRQRDQMQVALGSNISGRGDFSMAFIAKAFSALKPGGTVGTLMPKSLLTLQAAQKWRNWIAEEANIRLLGSLGDYGLFSYAMVQVAALVFCKPENDGAGDATNEMRVLVTADDTDATSLALRHLRKFTNEDKIVSSENEFQLFTTKKNNFENKSTWKLMSPRTERQLDEIRKKIGIVSIEDLFQVRQGIRTGMNSAFLLKTDEVSALPKRERDLFKPAIMNNSISSGCLNLRNMVFYPHSNVGSIFANEEELFKRLPEFSKRFLIPNKDRLANRASHVGSSRTDWWGLTRSRSTWALSETPRIVSKYFGGVGGFAMDLKADWIVVQGFAWFPNWVDSTTPHQQSTMSDAQILYAFTSLFNSRVFQKILSYFSPHVAGGQFDLSPRYVNSVPIPDLISLSTNEKSGRAISLLSELGVEPQSQMETWLNNVDRLVAELYGVDLHELD